MCSLRNAVYVAVGQVWVIVMGVLAAGFADRMWRLAHVTGSGPALWLLNHPLWFMLIPLGWITLASVAQVRPECTDNTRQSAFLLGIYLLVGLMIFVGYADITPWMHGTYGLVRNDGGD